MLVSRIFSGGQWRPHFFLITSDDCSLSVYFLGGFSSKTFAVRCGCNGFSLTCMMQSVHSSQTGATVAMGHLAKVIGQLPKEKIIGHSHVPDCSRQHAVVGSIILISVAK